MQTTHTLQLGVWQYLTLLMSAHNTTGKHTHTHTHTLLPSLPAIPGVVSLCCQRSLSWQCSGRPLPAPAAKGVTVFGRGDQSARAGFQSGRITAAAWDHLRGHSGENYPLKRAE